MADRIAVLREGRVVQHGTARELYDTPADPQLACFLGEANLLDATLTPSGADLGPLGLLAVLPECGGSCAESESREDAGASNGAKDAAVATATATTASVGTTATALIRPEQFSVDVCDDAADADSARAGIPGLVERCDYYGHDAMLTVRPQAERTDNVRRLPEKLLVRMPAGGQLSAGTLVKLTVRSPIAVWRAEDVPAAA